MILNNIGKIGNEQLDSIRIVLDIEHGKIPFGLNHLDQPRNRSVLVPLHIDHQPKRRSVGIRLASVLVPLFFQRLEIHAAERTLGHDNELFLQMRNVQLSVNEIDIRFDRRGIRIVGAVERICLDIVIVTMHLNGIIIEFLALATGHKESRDKQDRENQSGMECFHNIMILN